MASFEEVRKKMVETDLGGCAPKEVHDAAADQFAAMVKVGIEPKPKRYKLEFPAGAPVIDVDMDDIVWL